MHERFDVVEIEIKNPANVRVMDRDMTKEQSDSYIKMAVFRRGVDTHFYKAVPAGIYPQ